MKHAYVEIAAGTPCPLDMSDRVMAGEVFVVRECLNRLGIFEAVVQSSLEAVGRVADADAAVAVKRRGFEKIHEHLSCSQIEAVLDELYKILKRQGPAWIKTIAEDLFGFTKAYYFELCPNARFHVPYDVMAADREANSRFAQKSGGGKLAAHPNHRDSWVGCADNLMNIWAAVSPISEGNGLTIFPEVFEKDVARVGGSIAFDENPGKPLTFNLRPGDAILFHGDHIHSSVLNRTDETRHAVSFRIVNEKPHFPLGHFHHYAHSNLAGGPLRPLAEVPANLSWSYFESRILGAAEKLGLRAKEPLRGNRRQPGSETRTLPLEGERRFPLEAIPEDSMRLISEEVCVARIGADRWVAFARKCPHGGADLALGTITDGEITCPWHNLRFDPDSGGSACQAVGKVRMYDVQVEDGMVTVFLDESKTESS